MKNYPRQPDRGRPDPKDDTQSSLGMELLAAIMAASLIMVGFFTGDRGCMFAGLTLVIGFYTGLAA